MPSRARRASDLVLFAIALLSLAAALLAIAWMPGIKIPSSVPLPEGETAALNPRDATAPVPEISPAAKPVPQIAVLPDDSAQLAGAIGAIDYGESPIVALLGIVTAGDERIALIAQANGATARLRPGDLIAGETVKTIAPSSLVLVEGGREREMSIAEGRAGDRTVEPTGDFANENAMPSVDEVLRADPDEMEPEILENWRASRSRDLPDEAFRATAPRP